MQTAQFKRQAGVGQIPNKKKYYPSQMRTSKFRILLYIGLYCAMWSGHIAQAEPNDISLGNVTVRPDQVAVVAVKSLSSNATTHVRSNGAIQQSFDSLHDYGFGGLFLIRPDSKSSSETIEVTIQRRFKVSTPVSAVLDHQLYEQKDPSLPAITKLATASAIWRKEPGARQEAFRLVGRVLDELDDARLLRYSVVEFYLDMALELEQQKEIHDIFIDPSYRRDFILNLSGGKERLIYIKWKYALSLTATQKYEEAYPILSDLLDELDSSKNLQPSWNIIRERIRASVGNTALLLAYYRDDPLIREEGRAGLEKAAKRAEYLGEKSLLAYLQNALALYYIPQNETAKAIDYLRSSIQTHREIGVNQAMINPLANLATILRRQGQTNQAISLLMEAIELDNRYPDRTPKANLKLNLAELFLDIGKNQSARRLADQARSMFSRNKNRGGAAMANLVLGRALRHIGEENRMPEILELAVEAHEAALDEFVSKKDGDFGSPVSASEARVELARDYIAMQEFTLANTFAMQNQSKLGELNAPEVTSAHEFLPKKIQSNLLLTELALLTKAGGDFELQVKDTMALIDTGDNEYSYPAERLELMKLQMLNKANLEDFDGVQAILDDGGQLIDHIRNELDTNTLGPFWSHKSSQFIAHYIGLISSVAKVDNSGLLWKKIFMVLERNQAVSLRENRRLMANTHDNGYDAAIALDSVMLAEQNVLNAANEFERAEAQNKADEARGIYASRIEALHIEADPISEHSLSIDELQELLDPQEIVLRFYIRHEASLVFVITKQSFDVHELPPKRMIDESVRNIIRELRNKSMRSIESARSVAHKLQIDRLISGDHSRLIIVPDGVLNFLPFTALSLSKENVGYRPLVSDKEVVRTYSFSDYIRKRSSREKRSFGHDIAIFSDPQFRHESISKIEDSNWVDNQALRGWSDSLKRLPWTAMEAKHITETFKKMDVTSVSGLGATTEALMSGEMRNSKILHIASHGYFNESTPDVVGIATAGRTNELGTDTGFVSLTTLLSRPFLSNLVVISGCETALGEDLNSEGLNGLSRGILAQGAGAVIATIWPIPDQPTAKFMGEFYRKLVELEGDASKALSATKRSFLSRGRFKHPYFWSGFSLTSANQTYHENVFH